MTKVTIIHDTVHIMQVVVYINLYYE
jgi:hypothetical protein